MRRTPSRTPLLLLARIARARCAHPALDHVISPRSARREHAVIGLQVHARGRDQSGEALEEDVRLEDDVSRPVAPGVSQLVEQPTSS